MRNTPPKPSVVSPSAQKKAEALPAPPSSLSLGSVYEATVAYVESLPAVVRPAPEVALIVQLAEVVSSTSSARDVAAVSRELRAALVDVSALVGAIPTKGDFVDEIRAKRENRPA